MVIEKKYIYYFIALLHICGLYFKTSFILFYLTNSRKLFSLKYEWIIVTTTVELNLFAFRSNIFY